MSGHQLLDYQPPPDDGLPLLWSDEHLLIVDKPSGLLSVPGRGERYQDCMASRVQARYPTAEVVHRLDMDTSGLLLMALGKGMQRQLSELFLKRQVDKRYVAVLDGLMASNYGLVDLPLITDWPNRPLQKVDHDIGKPSQTRFVVLSRDPQADTTRVELEPITGRSHQLRVHMQALGHAIVGDPLYASLAARAKAARLLLHAQSLSFVHPVTGQRVDVSSEASF